MRKTSGGGDGKRGCGCTGLDFFVLFVILALVAWFGPWRNTLLRQGAPYLGKVPVIGRIFPSPGPSAPPAAPTPSPSPTEPPVAVTPSPSPTPTPAATATPTLAPSPTPPEPEDVPRPEAPYGSLSRDQEERAEGVAESLRGVDDGEAKRWRDNLAFDPNPERELRAWEAASEAYVTYVRERPGLNDVAKREAFRAALMGSLLPPAEAVRYLKRTALTPEEAKAIMATVKVKPAPLPPPTAPPAEQ